MGVEVCERGIQTRMETRDSRLPGAGVTGGRELSDVDAGNGTLVLPKSS